MNWILLCDWLPERATRDYLEMSRSLTVFCNKIVFFLHVMNHYWPSLLAGWILASFSFCMFMGRDLVSVHKHTKDVLGQYPTILTPRLDIYWGGAVASWLVRSTPERAVRVRALAGDIVFCSWARHFTPTVSLSTQVYKWVPANLMLGVTLRWTSIPSRGE